jgi:hypothetical protein
MQHGLYVLTPQKGNDDTYQFMDLTYIIPYIDDIKQFDITKWMFGNPMYRLPAEVMLNRSVYNESDIIPNKELYSGWENTWKYIQYVYQGLVPPLAPGGYNFQQLWDSIMKKPDYYGRLKELLPTLSSTIFGVKFRAINLTDEQQKRLYELKKKSDEIMHKMYSIDSNKGMTAEEKRKGIDSFKKKLENIYKESVNIGTGSIYLNEAKSLFEN